MFADAFALAAEAGVPAVIHAGETGPASYITRSIEMLGARRIGHGVAALQDARAMDLIRERGVTLEVCPSSNVCLGVAASLDQHPFRRMDAAGLNVTINSDDPPMFSTDLNAEYLKVAQTFGYTRDELKAFALRAARASLLPDERKAAIEQAIVAYAA
jgi:adenosine deaminase